MTSDRTFIAAEVGHDNDAEEAATSPHHLAPPRRSVGRTRTAITSRKASGHARATGRALPPRDRRYPIRPPHRVPVESPAAGIWVGLHVPSAVPGLGPDGDLREAVDRGAAPVRRIAGHPVEMAIVGQRDGQSAFGGAATGPNPTDRGKRGTKRHTLTDQRGAPLAVVVTAGVLVAVFAAVEVSRHVRIRRPALLYAGLLGALVLAWAVPPASLLTLSPVPRFLAAVAIAFAPVFGANLIFAQRFRDIADSGTAFGANLLGAMVGGVLEYLSLISGYRWLLVVVAVLYGLAFLTGRAHLNVVDRGPAAGGGT